MCENDRVYCLRDWRGIGFHSHRISLNYPYSGGCNVIVSSAAASTAA